MIRALRTLLWFAAVVVGLVVAASWLPGQLNRVQVPQDYEDLGGITPMTGVWLAPPPYLAGDTLAYRTGLGPDDIGFGIIVARPGEQVRLQDGELLVDGAAVKDWKPYSPYRGFPVLGPLTVPANHYVVLSNQHRRDSLTQGVIGPDQILGKVRE